MILRVTGLAGIVTVCVATTAVAQQVQTYGYDVHGRLTSAARTTGASTQTTNYVLDKANNRTSRTVTTASTMLLGEALTYTAETAGSTDQRRSDIDVEDKEMLPDAAAAPSSDAGNGDQL